MTEITTYQSSRGPLLIKEMPYPHLMNAIRKIERDGGDADVLAALKAEAESRPAPETPGGPNDAAYAAAPAARPTPAAAEFLSSLERPRGIGDNDPPPFAVILAEKYQPLAARVAQAVADAAAIKEVDSEARLTEATEIGRRITALEAEVKAANETEKAAVKPITDAINALFLTNGFQGQLGPTKTGLSQKAGRYLQAKADRERAAAEEMARRHQEAADERAGEAAEAETAGQNTVADVKMAGAMAHEQAADVHAARAAAPAAELARTHTSSGTASLGKVLAWDIDPDTVDLEKLRPYLHPDALSAAVRAMAKARGFTGAVVATQPIKGVVFKEEAKGRFR